MATTKLTKAEVATKNGKNEDPAWIIYKDSVYDVTKFVNEHPGGKSAILDESGKDASEAFDSVGHSSDAKDIMKKFKIGEIIEEEKVYDENGKRKKRMVAAAPENESNDRGCLSIITCGLL